MTNTYPAGVKNVGYASEISPTFFTPRRDVLLRLLMTIVRIVAIMLDSEMIRLKEATIAILENMIR
jgi:hypothetical protein